jgi:ATP-dependent Clp protease ATP-binding subunit ClpB
MQQNGEGVDENDNSLVRYTIIAHVKGHTEIEVLNFHRAWMKKHAKAMKKTTGAKADIDGLTVQIVSPGWTYAGIAQQKVEAALKELSKAGFDPVYGARPLKRAIQSSIENPLARQILEGRFADKDRIRVDCAAGVFRFEKAA